MISPLTGKFTLLEAFMFTFFRSVAFTVLVFFSCYVVGQLEKSSLVQEAKPLSAEEIHSLIKKKIDLMQPELIVSQPKVSAIPGFYTMRIEGGPFIYASDDGRYFFIGDLLSIQTDKLINLTERSRIEDRVSFLASNSGSAYISFAPSTAIKGVLNVFTDISCSFCRKLHRDMNELNALGIEVRYFAYPRQGLETSVAKQMVSAWCSNNPQSAITNLKQGVSIPFNVCSNNPIADHFRQGQIMGVSGTPAVLFADGSLLLGYREPKVFAQLLGIN